MLTVEPKKIFDNDIEDKSFTVYSEDDNYLYIPRFFA